MTNIEDNPDFDHALSKFEKARSELEELKKEMDLSNIRKVHGGEIREYCSFCGKSKSDVKSLIEGPGIYICNVCVRVFQRILDARGE